MWEVWEVGEEVIEKTPLSSLSSLSSLSLSEQTIFLTEQYCPNSPILPEPIISNLADY